MSTKRQKILIVIGTRPEAIKMAPLIHELRLSPQNFAITVCVTGQHRQMLDPALQFFEIEPDIDLNLMKVNQGLAELISRALASLSEVVSLNKPDIILVHGDTSTTLAASMASFFSGIPIGHIEAGLRTYRIAEPFPEEFNRQVVSKIAHLNFAPTEQNRQNLLRESVEAKSIVVTGNTVIDALFWAIKKIESDPIILSEITNNISCKLAFNWKDSKFVLITGHRRENFGNGIDQICNAISLLAKTFPDVHFVYPVHLNPKIQIPVFECLRGFSNIHLLEPLIYPEFIYLMKHCHIVLTDSGGIQEEAPSLGKPVLVMREVSERLEAIQFGAVRLIGTNRDAIFEGVKELLENKLVYQKMASQINPYGDGYASRRIVEVLKDRYAK